MCEGSFFGTKEANDIMRRLIQSKIFDCNLRSPVGVMPGRIECQRSEY